MLSTRLHIPGDRRFALLLSGLAVSSCGDWLYNVALLAVVFARTHSPALLAVTTAARVAPMVVLGPFGGVLADRYDRRRLIIVSDLTRAALMIALAIVAAAALPIILAPVIAAAATAAGVVHPPSVAASTARLVSEDELQRASIARATIGQAAIVVGPALGALILLTATPTLAIALNALTFLASAAAALAIGPGRAFHPAPRDAESTAGLGMLSEMRAGAEALRDAPAALRLVMADVLCSVVAGLLTVTLVLVARRAGAGSGGYGLLLGALGTGGVTGALLMSRIEASAGWRRAVAVALGLVGLAVAGLGIAPGLVAALALALLAGAGSIVSEVLAETALPRLLDDAVLARAYGLAFPMAIFGIVVGSLLAGPLVSLLGLTGTLVGTGGFVLAAAALLVCRPLEIRVSPALARTPVA